MTRHRSYNEEDGLVPGSFNIQEDVQSILRQFSGLLIFFLTKEKQMNQIAAQKVMQ